MSAFFHVSDSAPNDSWAPEPSLEDLSGIGGLRIGIDGRELLNRELTGIGRYLRNFVAYATEHFRETEFFLYGNQYTCPDTTASNLTVRYAPERVTRWWDQVTLPRLLREDRTDVLLSPYDKCPIRAPCPVVATVHDLLFLKISDRRGLRRFFYDRAYLWERRCLLRRAVTVITDSAHSRKDIIDTFDLPGDHVVPIPIGLPVTYLEVDKKNVERVRNLFDLKTPYILYVGNFKSHKNVGALIEAFATLPSEIADLHRLVLCGRRDIFRDRLAEWCQSLGIASRVTWIDFVEEGDLPGLYGGATLFVFPSLYEGFGLPPLEAMACGTPVVSSGATSLSEVLGTAAVLVDATSPSHIGEGISAVLNDADLYAQCVSSGRKRASYFTPDRASKTVLAILQNAARRSCV